MMITVICRDGGNVGYEPVLIYVVDADPKDQAAVLAAVIECRENDIGPLDADEKEQIEVLFAFDGDQVTVADWRD